MHSHTTVTCTTYKSQIGNHNFSIDYTAPAKMTVAAYDSVTTVNQLQVSGTRERHCQVRVDDITKLASANDDQWQLTLPLTEGSNSFNLTCVDAAGNASEALVISLLRSPGRSWRLSRRGGT